MEHFINALKLYAVFWGRCTRTEYWIFVLIYTVFAICFALISISVGSDLLINLFTILILVPSISVATRRLHDTGRNGWWQLLFLIPILGWIVLTVFLAQPSQGDNQYGPKPKLTQKG
ncbi:MAG: DUF805 domain-containing protein [Ghiorsea sp.]